MDRRLFPSLIAALLAACSPPVGPSDGDADGDRDADSDGGEVPDADADLDSGDGEAEDADPDADLDADTDADADGDHETASEPTPPPEVIRTGTADLRLRGVVLTPTGVLDPGEVLVRGAFVTCVAADCAGVAGGEEATWIETNGIISPGLIDAHNHLAYNFLPEWEPPRLFQNRYEWADDPSYEAHIRPYTAHRSSSSHFCPGAKWGELRSVVHGTTTIQGQPSASSSCINWGIRNANQYHGLGYDHMRQYIGSPRDIDDAYAAGLIADFDAAFQPVTRFHVHMAEGVGGTNLLAEFASFAGRDPRVNRHQGVSLLHRGTALLIHSVALSPAELLEVAETGSHVAWSPSSNMVLYGATAPVERMLELGINVAIGPDWTPSGEDEMLSELRFALELGRREGIAALTPERLWEMATLEGAVAVGLEDHIGQLAPGFRADVAVFGRRAPDPYLALVESRARDVRLVLVDGRGFLGHPALEAATARNGYCDVLEVCGETRYLCVQDSPAAPDRRNETLEDIRTQLYNILEGIGYPPEEQYGRGDELLELVDCEA